MKNYVIGKTSQLATYFPDSYFKLDSRNFDFNQFFDSECGSVYITFAEQRTFNKNLKEEDFISVNVDYTSKIIDFFSKKSKKVVIYGTAELWNNHQGPINMSTPIDYKYSPYVKSKEILHNQVLEKKSMGD